MNQKLLSLISPQMSTSKFALATHYAGPLH